MKSGKSKFSTAQSDKANKIASVKIGAGMTPPINTVRNIRYFESVVMDEITRVKAG